MTGSTDKSQLIIDEYVNKYPEKIRSFKNKNIGVAATRNFGIKQISGDYFLFVDSDDYIELNLLQKLQEIICNNPVEIIKYKMQILYEKDIKKIDGPTFNFMDGCSSFDTLCFSDKLIDTPCLYLFNTNFYTSHNFVFKENTYHEDFGLIPLILLNADSVCSIDFYGYYYIQSNNSITRNNNYEITFQKTKDLLTHYDNMLNKIKDLKIPEETRINIKQYYSNAIFSSIKKLNRTEKIFYKQEIKKRKLINNIKVKNIKSFVKKLFLYVLIFK